MARTNMTEDQVWNQFYRFYQLQRFTKQDNDMYYNTGLENAIEVASGPRMKSLEALMTDYLSDGGDGHACNLNDDVPKYFYYGGKEYTLNFENLDYIHTKMIMHKLENNLIGAMTEEENLQMFMDFTNPEKKEDY